MRKIGIYFQEAFQELVYKVTWPAWKELQSSAIVVMVATLIISLIIAGMDYGLENILKLIYKSFF